MGVGVDPIVSSNTVPQYVGQALYDTVIAPIAAGTLLLPLFSVSIGQGTTAFGTGAKTEADTNMLQPSQLAMGWQHEAKAIALVGWSTAVTQLQDTQLAIAGAVFFYELGTTRWLTIPARRLTGGCGISGFASGLAAAGFATAHIGDAQPMAVLPINPSIKTSGGVSIGAGIRWPGGTGAPALTAAVPLSVFLEGQFYRRV